MNTSGTPAPLPWNICITIARRELSARFRGLRLLIICLFIGVAALSAIGSLTSAISGSIAARGRIILGGDLEIAVWQRGLTAPESQFLNSLGTVTSGTRMQAMAAANNLTLPVELKSVDGQWPLVGRLKLTDGRQVGAPSANQAWLAPAAAERLQVKQGHTITISGQALRVGGIIADEPDRLGEGFALGPTVITAADLPMRAGLISPGAMYRSKIRLTCASSCNPPAIAERIKSLFPTAGLTIRTSDKAVQNAENFISVMGEFLVMIALAALLVAGLGIGGGTTSYLEARRNGIATLKILGASGQDIARIYLLQITVAALVGSIAGLLAGALLLPLLLSLLAQTIGTLIPIDRSALVDPAALARAAGFGLLVALTFAAPPLAAAKNFPAMALMRARVTSLTAMPRVAYLPTALGGAALVGLALFTGPKPAFAAGFLAAAAAIFALLAGLGWAIRRMAARLPRPRHPIARLGLSNLHRPGGQTARLVTALGFGLSTFVLLAVVETSLEGNMQSRIPQRAPDYFIMGLAPDKLPTLTQIVTATAQGAVIRSVPAMRGAILAYGPADNMTHVADLDLTKIPEDAWALKGERGLTFSEQIPLGNALTDGTWWGANYTGTPLVSVDEKFAAAIDLKIGDRLTISLLGVERSATIASFRRIDWDSLGSNYVLVFSPNALSDAPYKLASTISLPASAKNATTKGAMMRAITAALPAISAIEVGGLLQQAHDLLGQMSMAILAAASVTVLAGMAVLIGAITAARAAKLYDNVILRVLGASRAQLLTLIMAEFAGLVLILALVALAIGSALGWLIMVHLFKFSFLPNWPWVLAVLGGGVTVILCFALLTSLPLLRAKPAAALREL
ncbi:MAG: hypothetical protein RLY97_908 [Pseudomonadota bacterium]